MCWPRPSISARSASALDNASSSRRRFSRPGPRRLIQLYSALLYNAHLRGFIEGKIYQGNAKYICAPGLNCYSCPGATLSCPLGAIQNALSAAGHRAPWYILGMLLLFGVILGRTVCGWLCPLGLLQELAHKIPLPKLRKSRFTRVLSLLKYVILVLFVLALPLYFGLVQGEALPAFCKYICPAGTSEGALPLLAHPENASLLSRLGLLFTNKIVILVILLAACAFCYRAFCRFLCPLGALYGLFNRFCIVGVKVNGDRCIGCDACLRACPMDVKAVGDRECIQCGKCMEACAPGAISIRAGRITLKGPETGPAPEKHLPKKTGRALWGGALALLCFALLWFNVLDPSLGGEASSPAVPSSAGWVSDAPVGSRVGEQLPDFTLNCYDGTRFHLAEHRGKVVFLNLWATYCAPCIRELPFFSSLALLHGEDAVVLAVHPALVIEDPAAFLGDQYPGMLFATDEENAVAKAVGDNGVLPRTVVLNRRGEIIYNEAGSVTAEMLSDLFDQANLQP